MVKRIFNAARGKPDPKLVPFQLWQFALGQGSTILQQRERRNDDNYCRYKAQLKGD
jgi:hypothetical protein